MNLGRPAWTLALVAAVVVAEGLAFAGDEAEMHLDVRAWRIIPRESGKVDYYRVLEQDGLSFIRSDYKPGYDTAVLGYRMSDADRDRAKTLRWQWRAQKLPVGGNECASGHEDSAAVVYVSWKRGLRYYTIKYAWSAVGPKGATCDKKRSPFVAQDTVIVESGGAVGQWRSVTLDLRAEYRNHFEGGDPNAAVPEFLGVAIMSDGDQTQSDSSADYANFAIGF